MRKRILILILLVVPFFLFPATHKAVSPLYLTGIRGADIQFFMTLDSEQAFSMQAPELAYTGSASTGLRIASWFLVSNTNEITLTLSHTPLVSDLDPSVSIDYYLALQYVRQDPYNLYVRSSDGSKSINFKTDSYYRNIPRVAITNYGMFIRLAEEFDTSGPAGHYRSTITMRVVSN